MIEYLRSFLFGEEKSNEQKVFNILHIVVCVGLFCATFLVYLYIPNIKALYYSIGIFLLAMLTFVEANRTGHYLYPAVIMSFAFNFLFFPMLFIYYDKLVCCIPSYFVIGMLYTVMLIPGKKGVGLMLFQTLVYFVIIEYFGKLMPIPYNNEAENFKLYLGVYIAVIVGGVCCGIAIYFRASIHRNEKKKLDEYHIQVMDAFISKDIFLINMSHEIRTPMNAIVGTVNLLLDEEVSERVRDSVYNILNSCNALLSITNELMDLSKSDIKDITISNAKYDLGELLLEIINMMSVRMMDSDTDFFVDIDTKLPRYLYGDASRIRQLFINILNNAIKYTKVGSVTLRVYCERISDNEINLKVEVEDTGIGIKEESIPKLFTVYQRVEENEKENRNVEGTGLGLSICKEIIDKMNGEITVKSEYHVGSTFSFYVPQKFEEDENLVGIIEDDDMSILVYEHDDNNSDRLKKIFDTFKLRADFVFDSPQFENIFHRKRYTHVFIDRDKYMENIKFLDLNLTDEKVIVISKINQTVSLSRFGCVLLRPIHSLNINTLFNNESNQYVRDVISRGSFACPNANILVVDDNLTNLTVARGLLKKYEANVTTALSGKECLNILENQEFDLIFLDYMMPEMNGIDTLNRIRAMDNPKLKTLPVIALTANVVNGAREMFLEAGFNDYISKPIEVERIEKALKTYIPRNIIVGKNR